MRPARHLGLIAILLLSIAESRPARADELERFLGGMSDSTSLWFGPTSVTFDTTGVDSLLRVGGNPKLGKRSAFTQGLHWTPKSGFNRAEGHSVGLEGRFGHRSIGELRAGGSYGFANQEGRYRFAYRRELWRRTPVGDPEFLKRVTLRLAYARETAPFAPEHADPFSSTLGALLTGRDRQSVYESRGVSGAVEYFSVGLAGGLGYHAARDQSMPRATRETLWGRDRTVPLVTPADEGSYREATAFLRLRAQGGLLRASIDGSYGARDRWRVRAAAARKVLTHLGVDAHLEAEGGLTAREGRAQQRFELGGPLAVPSLGFGDVAGDRLLLGKFEVVHGVDVLRGLHLPHPSFLVLHPSIFAQGGSVWARGEGAGEWSAPPRDSWRGAAGVSLVHLPGIPTPASYLRLQMAWPIGRESGVPRFSLSFNRWFDLIGK